MSKQHSQESPDNVKEFSPPGFPHFTRFFSALFKLPRFGIAGKILLWSILAIGIGANLVLTDSAVKKQLTAIVKYRLASFVPEQSRQAILGASNVQSDMKNQPDTTTDSGYTYWMEIVRAHPDYRDGYFMVATLAYQRGNMQQAREYLNKVREIDPNYPGIVQLAQELSGE